MDHGIPERYTRTSFMDMLPDVITDGEMDAMKRHMKGEAMGLIDCVCAECGKAFIAHREHRYRYDPKKGPVKMYCSYRCFRKMEQKDAEAWRKRVMGAWAGPKEQTAVDYAREEVTRSRDGLEAAQAKKDSPAWETMTKEQRRKLDERIAKWQARLVLAETELEEAMASEKN